MFLGLRTIIYPVADVERAKAWYTELLGHGPYFDQPYYVGFTVGGFELALDPHGTASAPGQGGPITYWGVPNADEAIARLLALGATAGTPVADVGDGIRVGTVIDPFGNTLGIIQNPHFSVADVR